MRRLVIGTALLVGCGVACVSSDTATIGIPPYPIHPVRSRRDLPGSAQSARVPHPGERVYGYSAAWYPRGRRISPRWTHIVIHHSATAEGGAKQFDKYHRLHNGWDELGYHFVIGNGTDTPDGFVEVGPRWQKQKHGAHCKTPDNYYNEHGIGICLVGDFTKTGPTPKQVAALKALVRFLADQRGIPPERVTTHGAITPKTQCPGSHFNLAALRRALATTRTALVLP